MLAYPKLSGCGDQIQDPHNLSRIESMDICGHAKHTTKSSAGPGDGFFFRL